MKTHLKISTLISIASKVEKAIGLQFGGTWNEMRDECIRVAGNARTRVEAARAIAEGIYNHSFGDFTATDEAILNAVRQ